MGIPAEDFAAPSTAPRQSAGRRIAPVLLLLCGVVPCAPLLAETSSLEVRVAASSAGSFGVEAILGQGCRPTDPLVLGPPDSPVTGSHQSCVGLLADGVVVAAPGGSFVAGEAIQLGEGFSVGHDAGFSADIDQQLSPLAYLEDDSPRSLDFYSATFSTRLNELSLDSGDRLDHLVGLGPRGEVLFRFSLVGGATPSDIGLILAARRDDGTFAETPLADRLALPSGYNHISVFWEAGAGTGLLRAIVNSASNIALGNLSNGSTPLETIRWGAVSGSLAASSGRLQLDDYSAIQLDGSGQFAPLFSDGFESGDLCAWSRVSPRLEISGVTPGEGSVGASIEVEGIGLGHADPFVSLLGGPSSDAGETPLTVVSVAEDRIVARLDDVVPAGTYGLKVSGCRAAVLPESFEVRPPGIQALAPEFVRQAETVSLSGEFLGSQAGRVLVRPQSDPAGWTEGAVLSWQDDNAEFQMPSPLAQNGFHDVMVINGIGSDSLPAGLVAIDVDDGDDEDLRLIGAVATSNTEILVQFSEAVQGGMEGAENPAHYSISGQPAARTPTVGVLAAEVLRPGLSTVRLTTISQSDILYTLTVVNVRDLAGNPLVGPSIGEPNPNQRTFIGRSPGSHIDSDGDGLSDADEQLGWLVTITRANGSQDTRHVTSEPGNPFLPVDDPFNVAARDTDGDGVNDNDEQNGGMNPRTGDTDGDVLTDDEEWNAIYSDPTHQDTDGDGVQDGVEFSFFRTSPILADTDGDQIMDLDEVFAGNRNPLISDLPSPRIRVGNFSLRLDERTTDTRLTGDQRTTSSTTESTLTRGEDQTFATSNENSTSSTLEFSQELTVGAEFSFPGVGASVEASFGSTQGSERGNTFVASEESGRSSEESFHESLEKSITATRQEEVTFEIVDAAVKVGVTIENTGDLPFAISNLELTAQTQDPANRREMIAVASLVPENENLGTPDNPINIGALGDSARGPFVFTTVSVFPNQVQELMKNPRGFVVRLANFDITAEDGRNFAFISQEVLDRTAGISFDLGDGRTENYRVATASAHDRATGVPLGITMRYALEDVIGLYGSPTVRDGGDGLVNTQAAGDDVQVVGFPGLTEPGAVLVTVGENGVLDTVAPGGDDEIVDADYETEEVTQIGTVRDGGNGLVETVAMGDDVQLVPAGAAVKPGQVIIIAGTEATDEIDSCGPDPEDRQPCSPPGDDIFVAPLLPHEALSRFRDKQLDDEDKRFWVLYTSEDLPAADLEELVIRSGEQYDFAYVQDRDGDGVWAREEYIHNSSDGDVNTDGDVACANGAVPSRDAPPSCDTLDDKAEIQEGWRVEIKGTAESYLAYPDPVKGDSDRDRLADDEERDCKIDPRQRDTDADGLNDWEELTGQRLGDGGAVIPMVSRDPASNLEVFTIVPYKDQDVPATYLNGEAPPSAERIAGMTTHFSEEACDTILGFEGFATDPLDPDTDGDEVSDFDELRFGIDPNFSGDGGDFLDDDGDGVSNNDELVGFEAFVNCASPRCQSGFGIGELCETNVDCGGGPGAVCAVATDPVVQRDQCRVQFTSNPFVADTDGDGLGDLLEHSIRSNPRSDELLGFDTDGDGLTDLDEYLGDGRACVTETETPGDPCVVSCAAGQDCVASWSGFQAFVTKCGAADVCDENLLFDTGTGTNLNERDSDFDGLEDDDEIDGVSITVDDGTGPVAIPVTSDPLNQDTDGDLLDDDEEREAGTDGTNPRSTDTDGDTTLDPVETENGRGRNPAVADRRVRIDYDRIEWSESDCDGAVNENWVWRVGYQDDGDIGSSIIRTAPGSNWAGSDLDIDTNLPLVLHFFNGGPATLILKYGEQFALIGFLQELDSGDVTDEVFWTDPHTVNGSLPFGTTARTFSDTDCGGTQKVFGSYTID